jgi:hypothetical protein
LEEKKEALRKAASESSLVGSTLEEKLEKLNSTKPKPFGSIHAVSLLLLNINRNFKLPLSITSMIFHVEI